MQKREGIESAVPKEDTGRQTSARESGLATGGVTEAQSGKQTVGVIPDEGPFWEDGSEGFTVPPAEWGKTSGSPSGGIAGGTPAQQLEGRRRRQEADHAASGE